MREQRDRIWLPVQWALRRRIIGQYNAADQLRLITPHSSRAWARLIAMGMPLTMRLKHNRKALAGQDYGVLSRLRYFIRAWQGSERRNKLLASIGIEPSTKLLP